MSLAEIPPNHVRRNGQFTHSKGPPPESRPRAGAPNGVENSEILSKPSSIQSMLRNTTETGDVGQFSIKPSRIPSSIPRLSPARSNKSRSTPSKRRHLDPYYNGTNGYSTRHVPASSHHGSTASNGSSSHTQGQFREPQRMPSLEDFRSYSMAQSLYSNHSLPKRHPYTNGHHHARGNMQNVRPRSPYAYPTRLKRPGYRPSSPALSELNKSIASPNEGFKQEPSTRTASPSSAYNMNRTPSPFRYVINRSDPNLLHYPPYLGTETKRARSPSLSSTRPSTPKPSPSLTSIASSSLVYQTKSVTNGSWLHPQSSPVSPVYYDYTEGFEEPENFQSTSISMGMPAEHLIPYMESSTYSELGGSPDSTGIAELPAENSPKQTTLQNHDFNFNQSTLEVDMVGDGITQTALQDLSDVPELSENEVAATEAERLPEQAHFRAEPGLGLSLPQLTPVLEAGSQMPQDNEGRLHKPHQELATDFTALRVSRASNQGSTSPIGSIFSAKSSVVSKPKPSTPEPAHRPISKLIPQLKLESPVIISDLGDTATGAENTHPPESLRGPSFEGHSRVSTEILSPTPERSIISTSNRDRFSKILSIEEGLTPSDTFVAPFKRKEMIFDSPVHEAHNSNVGENSGVPLRKRSLYMGNSPLKQSVISDTLVEKSESGEEDEPELTAGLRQTFCKDDEPMLRDRKTSSPMSLPSQVASQKFTVAVGVQRSPAIRRSITKLPTLAQGPPAQNNEDFESPNEHSVSSANRPHSVNNELRLLPGKQPSFKSFPPPTETSASDLPLDFIPLIQQYVDGNSVIDPEAEPSSNLENNESVHEVEGSEAFQSELEKQHIRYSAASPPGSVTSRPSSQPWNNDSSYPWNDQLPELEVTMPQPAIGSQKLAEKSPRFKLKIHRASSSTGATSKFRKELLPAEAPTSPFASSHDLSPGPAFRRKNPNLSVIPGQINSSHDIIQSSRQQTRFVETFATQSPTISLLPPSPGYEVRSFFSDDSSQIHSKGSLRKRFSDFRARAAAARATSTDETRGYDRGLLNSALGRSRASGRSSRQSQNTAAISSRTSYARRVRWKMMDKLKLWLQRGEGKVRDWGWKMRYRNGKNRSASTPLYAGV